jgi:thiol-disulfide isomerase/thioredoxin
VKDSIEAYSKKMNMSDFVKKWAYVHHKISRAEYINVRYRPEKLNKWDFAANPIFDVFDENNFQSTNFNGYSWICMTTLTSEEEINRLMLEEENYVSAIRLTIEKLFEKTPKGIVRDFMLFKYLKGMPEWYELIPEIKTAFSNDFFNKELEKIYKPVKISGTETQLNGVFYMTDDRIEKLPDTKLFNFLMEKYKGKLIFIDIWGTNCPPCLEEFKYTPELHKYFKDKDVVFVNLCVNSDIEYWKPAIMKHNINGENYFLDNKATRQFRIDHKKYSLSGYPHYLLLDKNGEIHYHLPRPSNFEFVSKKIEACLN